MLQIFRTHIRWFYVFVSEHLSAWFVLWAWLFSSMQRLVNSMINIGIFGYGNLGRGVKAAVRQNDDLCLNRRMIRTQISLLSAKRRCSQGRKSSAVCACVSAGLRTPARLCCCLTVQFLLAFENKALYWKFFLIILICLELIFKGQMQEEYNGNVAATGFRWFSAHVVVNLHSYLIAGTLRESEWWRFTGVFI